MKKLKKVKIVFISFLMVLLLCIAYQILIPRDAGKEMVTIIELDKEAISLLISASQKERILYNTINQAIVHDKTKDIKYISDIKSFDNKDTKIRVKLIEQSGEVSVTHLIFFLEDNKISSSFMERQTSLKYGYDYPFLNLTYTEEEKIAQFILNGTRDETLYEYTNEGRPLYHGISDKKNIYNMKILDKKPTDIIPFEYESNIYYYWYFEGVSFVDEISHRINKDEFTLEELEKVLEIKYVD